MSEIPALNEITAQPGLGKFNGYMTSRSFVVGYKPSTEDVKVFAAFKSSPPDAKSAPHAYRWFKHIETYSAAEQNAFAAPSAEEKSAAAPVAAQKKTEEVADDAFGDDDDLFGDDGGAAAEALQEKLKKEAKERAASKLKNARSMIVFEVKPYEAEYDLEALAQAIKKMEHEGIQNWGAEHKLQPVAYGIKKLVISCIVYDELIGFDDIVDMINEKFEEDVQSIDIQAMSKV